MRGVLLGCGLAAFEKAESPPQKTGGGLSAFFFSGSTVERRDDLFEDIVQGGVRLKTDTGPELFGARHPSLHVLEVLSECLVIWDQVDAG